MKIRISVPKHGQFSYRNRMPCLEEVWVCPWCGGWVVLGADSSSLDTYGMIHISIGHISAQVRILVISCHIIICKFHFIWHFEWPAYI